MTNKTTAKVVKIPRGIRNNNPLNIEYHDRNRWHGQLAYNKLIEPRFCRFEHMMWGYRAAACLLRKYIRAYGLTTVKEIINMWAPPRENQTSVYIKQVCDLAHMYESTIIDFNDQMQMLALMSAMTVVENGAAYNPQQNSTIWDAMYKGYKMAQANVTDFAFVEG